MRESLGPVEVADLQQTYDDLLDLSVRVQAEYQASYNDINHAWEAVIKDLVMRRTALLLSIEPALKRSVDVARVVQEVTQAFARLPRRPMSEWQVEDEGVSQSLQAVLPAASEYGYDATIVDNKLALRRGEVEIRLGFMPHDGEVGLGPHGAVRYLEAHRDGEFHVQYNGIWEGVATDKDLQRDVDRAIAIFG